MVNLDKLSRIAWNTATPFMIGAAVKFMENIVGGRVFEWGSGGSTVWFSRRSVSVVSVEHSAEWFKRVSDRIAALHLKNIDLRFVPKDPAGKYADTILSVPHDLDVVSVDGRNRVLCVSAAVQKIVPGGYLILDNSERMQYRAVEKILAGWERWDFTDGWTTSIFRRPLG